MGIALVDFEWPWHIELGSRGMCCYANAEWKKSKAQMTGAWVAAGAQFGFLFWQLNKISNNERGTPQLIGNIACGVIGSFCPARTQSGATME